MKLRRDIQTIIWIVVFGLAFGLVEATVVYYLRSLLHVSGGYEVVGSTTLINVGFIAFIKLHQPVLSSYTGFEMNREAATIIMLIAVAMVSSSKWRQRIGAFMIAFATWDLSYYGFLHILAGWPPSLLSQDVFFLLPVAWVGPVITPIVASLVLWLAGTYLYLSQSA